MSSTHIDEQLLTSYSILSVTAAAAAGIEAHLMTCQACRAKLGAAALEADGDSYGRERMWDGIVERVDQPRLSITERLLRAVGVRAETARLLTTTPALRAAWLAAVVFVAAFAVAAAGMQDDDPWTLLVVAPLLPLAGVATAFGPRLDPTYEIGMAAPFSGLRLTLLRTVGVLATTVPALLVATVATPGAGWAALGWLLPALALVSLTLALSSWISPERAGMTVGVGWVVALIVLMHRDSTGDFLANSMMFTPSGQLVMGALTCGAMTVVAARRHCFDSLILKGAPT